MFKKTLGLLLIVLLLFSTTSCKKRPELDFSETEDTYCYVNLEYGSHERHFLDLVIPKNTEYPQGLIL